MFTIDSGYKVPEKASRKGRGETYPFSKLEVGQSFFVPNTESPNGDAVQTLKRTAYSAERRFDEAGTKQRFTVGAFTLKTTNEDGSETETQGARIWRSE